MIVTLWLDTVDQFVHDPYRTLLAYYHSPSYMPRWMSPYILYQDVYNVMWKGSSCQSSARSLHSHRWLASLLGRVLDHEPTTCTLYMCPVLWIPVPPPKTPHWGLSDKTKQNLAAVRIKPQNTSSKLLSGAYLRQFSKSHWSENMRPRIIHHTISPQASKSRTNLVFCSLRKV